jgi:4-nitrophenyl phosphatase/NagD protein
MRVSAPVDPAAFLIDMDGVLFHGDRPLPGARALLDAVADRPYLFVTNNPILPPAAVVAKLARLGLGNHAPDQVLTSAAATASWLAAQHPGFRYYAVGAAGLHLALAEVGIEDRAGADFVVVGEGPGLDYESLALGINLIAKGGARLVVTNPDLTVDADRDGTHWILPGGGALVAPFAAATGQPPVVVGKPQPLLFEMALARLGTAPAGTLMIGDRPDTDIAGAAAVGLRTALVRTGRFAPGAAWPAGLPRPDWDVATLGQLLQLLDRLAAG